MKYVLGIDVGGTKIAAGLVDKYCNVTEVKVLPTSQTNLPEQLFELIKSYKDFDRIGLALPGPVQNNGFVQLLPNIRNFKPTNIKNLIKNKFKVTTNVINDAKAFTLAEAIIGSGKKFKKVAGVILGTGIGSGLVINKKVYTDKLPFDGEIGHIFIADNLTLEKMMQQSKSEFKSPKQAEGITRIILSMIISAEEPDIIVFGGGRSNYKGMKGILSRSLKSIRSSHNVKVEVSKLKYAGIIGAALPLLKR